MKKVTTQNDRIIEYMRQFGGITQLEALRDLGVMRLASRICDLRRAGYHIRRNRIEVKNRFGEVVRVTRYELVEEEAA